MKRIITGALVLLLAGGTAQAQKMQGADKQHGIAQMEKLNLTPEQKTALQALRAQQKTEWEALRNNKDLPAEKVKTAKAGLAKKHQAQVKALLTPEQQKQRSAARAAKGKNAKAGMHRHHKKELSTALALSAEQQTKMNDLKKSFKAKRQTVQQDKTLSEAQKRESLKALAQQHRKGMKGLLTAEQQQKLDALRKHHRAESSK